MPPWEASVSLRQQCRPRDLNALQFSATATTPMSCTCRTFLQCITSRRRDQTCVQFVRPALHVIRKSRAAEFKCAQSADTDHLPQGPTAQHALEWAGKQQCALARSMKCACLDAAAQVQNLQLPAAPRQALHALLCDPLTPAQIHTPQLPAPMETSFSITASTHFEPCMLLLGTSANVLAYDCKV